jgi:recombination protein RecR
MSSSLKSLEELVEKFSKFPGIGRKTAQRMAFYILNLPKEEVVSLAGVIRGVKEKVRFCSVCFNLTEEDPCPICTDPQRDSTTICVVEEAKDVLSIDQAQGYNGLFHVLGGVISPLDGVGPEELRIKELRERLKKGIKEVIIATNPTTEGEATALYLSKIIKPLEIKTTRIARGIPIGGELEYTDKVTLSKAIEGRMEM